MSYYFHRFSCNQVAVNLDATAVLVRNGNIIEKPFVYFFQKNLFLQISKRSSVQIFKLLAVGTLKNSQSSVTFKKHQCKQLRYYFPNQIKNSTHSNEKILRLKQESKFKMYS